jgi:hypothetical protein
VGLKKSLNAEGLGRIWRPGPDVRSCPRMARRAETLDSMLVERTHSMPASVTAMFRLG